MNSARPSVRNIAILPLLFAGCGGPIGESFEDVDAIGMSETWAEWVVVGSFGPKGPFKLVDIKECDYSEPCSFSHEGQGHTYTNFLDYKLTILQLENSDGQVSHVVLRSEDKRLGSNY